MKNKNVMELAAGIFAIVAVLMLLAAIGHCAEPYLQWVPSVRDLSVHAFWNTTVEPDTSVARDIYVGMDLLLVSFLALLFLELVAAVGIHVADIGRRILYLLGFSE